MTPVVLPPHAPLPLYYSNEAEHQAFLRRIFDNTAADYDRIESVLAFGTGPSYRRAALQQAGLAPGAEVLDVGIGTGLVAREALKLIGPTGKLVGVDPSAGMMDQVKLPGVELVQGVAEALPRPDASCDFVSMGYAMRHISDVAAAFGELSEAFAVSRRRSFDEIAEEMIRPMLRDWLDNNLPMLVERLVREEIERVARGGQG